MGTHHQAWRHWQSGLGILGALALVGVPSLRARGEFPPCPPPSTDEYLLLVRGDTENQRTRVQDLVPANSPVMVCNYLGDAVVRAGGFSSLENANAWAQYMTEVEGLQAFVARPAAANPVVPPDDSPDPSPAQPAPSEPDPPQPTPVEPEVAQPDPAPPEVAQPDPANPSAVAGGFRPQYLGTGYAVLVDYQYRPETAAEVEAKIGQSVGLAVFRQRAYLLVAHSGAPEGAITTLSILADLGIAGFVVDSREAVMLTPAVTTPDS